MFPAARDQVSLKRLPWTKERFDYAVRQLRRYGKQRVYDEMKTVGLVSDAVIRVDDAAPFNVFAYMAAGKVYNRECDSIFNTVNASPDWFVARGLEENEAQWENPELLWSTGRAAMSRTHKFICSTKRDWRMVNVSLAAAFMPVDEFKQLIDDLWFECRRYAGLCGLKSAGFFIHPLGYCSVYSWHTHVIDLAHVGPSYHAQWYKNMPLQLIVEWAHDMNGETDYHWSDRFVD